MNGIQKICKFIIYIFIIFKFIINNVKFDSFSKYFMKMNKKKT